MYFSCQTDERRDWMKQKALELLGFPLAEPWSEILPFEPGPLDGRTVDFGGARLEEQAVRILLLQLARDRRSHNFAGRFIVLCDSWTRVTDRDARILSGHTVELVENEIIRYQPIIFSAAHARIQAVADAGVFSEVDADDVSAWTGENLGLSLAKRLHRERN